VDEPETVQAAGPGPAPLPVGIVCPDCGYDLRGSTSARCSECGFALDGLRSQETQVPWSHRRELGWLRAYWKTVWLVLRRPKQFCLEMSRPVSYADSQSFRWITTLHAYPPVVVVAAVWYYFEQRRGRGGGGDELWLLAGVLIWLLLALVLLPGLASYFFQPREHTTEQQNRAIALSYYAWSPLALLLFALPMPIAVLLLDKLIDGGPRVPTWSDDLLLVLVGMWALSSGVLCIAAPLLAYARLADFAWRTQHRRGVRGFLRMALLWFLSAVLLILLTLPLVAGFYLLVVYHSLR